MKFSELPLEANRGPPTPPFLNDDDSSIPQCDPTFKLLLAFISNLTHEAENYLYLSPMTMTPAHSRTSGAKRASKTTTSDGGFIATLSRFWQVIYLS